MILALVSLPLVSVQMSGECQKLKPLLASCHTATRTSGGTLKMVVRGARETLAIQTTTAQISSRMILEKATKSYGPRLLIADKGFRKCKRLPKDSLIPDDHGRSTLEIPSL